MMMPLVFSIASLCACVFSFFFFRWYIVRKTAARELLADYRSEVHRLIAEIDSATDRDSLLVEERIKTINKLLEDTDRRIGVYMRELHRSRSAQAMYDSLGRGIRAALDSRPPQLEGQDPAGAEPLPPLSAPLLAPLPAPLSAPLPGPAQAPAQAAAASGNAEPGAPQPPRPSAGKRKPKKAKLRTQIAELAAKGLSPQQIASRMKLSMTEVDLALNLIQRPGL